MSYDDLFKRPSRNRFAAGSDPNDVLAGQLASIGSITPSGFTQEAENDQRTVRIDTTGIAVTGGKITVTNPGGTVVIDGSSNMFKIQASGSQSLAVASTTTWRTDSVTVTLSGLGALSTIPAILTMMGASNSATDSRLPSHTGAWSQSVMFAATTSGGSPTAQFAAVQTHALSTSKLDASNFAVIGITTYSTNGVAATYYQYYHVLKEAAL